MQIQNNREHGILFYVLKKLLLLYRLDVFHFINRFGTATTSARHPLYKFFISQVSKAVLILDQIDYKR